LKKGIKSLEDTTLRKYRNERGFTQQKLADLLKIPRTTMSFYETKKMYPPLEVAEKIANILGKTIGQLYSEEELKIIK
jgi:DNA-binding XRE family transcriptional regulator